MLACSLKNFLQIEALEVSYEQMKRSLLLGSPGQCHITPCAITIQISHLTSWPWFFKASVPSSLSYKTTLPASPSCLAAGIHPQPSSGFGCSVCVGILSYSSCCGDALVKSLSAPQRGCPGRAVATARCCNLSSLNSPFSGPNNPVIT